MLGQPEFGQRLKALRLERKLSQIELAGSGMSAGYLSRLESGDRAPTAKIVDYLSGRLAVSPLVFAVGPADSLTVALALAATGSDGDGDVETIAQLCEALRGTDDAAPAIRWYSLWLLANLQGAQLQRQDEVRTLLALAELADTIDIPQIRVRSLNRLALCHRSLGDVEKTHAAASRAAAIAGDTSVSLADRARAMMLLISAEAEIGRLPDARAHADDLLSLVSALTGTLPVEALWTAATVSIRQGDQARAGSLLDQALQRLDSRENLTLWLRLRLAAASLYLQMAPPRTADAGRRLGEAKAALDLVGTSLHRREFLLLEAQLAFEEGRHDDARAGCAQLEPSGQELTFRDRIRFGLLREQLRFADGDREPAVQALRELAEQAQSAANIDLAVEVWRKLAELLSSGTTPPGKARSSR